MNVSFSAIAIIYVLTFLTTQNVTMPSLRHALREDSDSYKSSNWLVLSRRIKSHPKCVHWPLGEPKVSIKTFQFVFMF